MPSGACFRRRHLLEAAVGAVGGDAYRSAAPALAAVRIGRQRAGDQFVAVVQPRGDAVHGADEGAGAAAHHAEAQPAPHRRLALALDRPSGSSPLRRQCPDEAHRNPVLPTSASHISSPRPSIRRLAAMSTPEAAKSSKARRRRLDDVALDERRAFGGALLGLLMQHSHSSTAQPSKPYCVSLEKMLRNRPGRRRASGSVRRGRPRAGSRRTRPAGRSG